MNSTRQMNLPTEQECLQYFEEFKVPSNIFKHCLKVQSVSVFLAEILIQDGISVNVQLVSCLSLIHDLFKPVVIENFKPFSGEVVTPEQISIWKELREKYSGKFENDIAYEFFKEEYPLLALTIKNGCDPGQEKESWEEKIVHYVDWRTSEDQLISLNTRMDILEKRYPNEEKWGLFRQIAQDTEKDLFNQLRFKPEQLAEEMNRNGQ